MKEMYRMKKQATKAGLRQHVDARINTRQNDLRTKAEAAITERTGDILKRMFATDKLGRLGDQLLTEYQAVRDKYLLKDYIYNRLENELQQHAIHLTSKLSSAMKNQFRPYIENPANGHWTSFDEELNIAVAELQVQLKPFYAELTKLDALHTELIHAVNAERSGNWGLKALIALGVDMKEYQEKLNPKLPAIVKLSVDPALINPMSNPSGSVVH